MKKLIAVLIGVFLLCSMAQALEVPSHYNWVNDFANVIDDEVESQLNERIEKYEKQTTNEITVVTISSLEGESLEGFSIKLAEEWGVGKEGKDNGIVLLFAVEEKRVRLEVGYGLEGVINDAKAGRILDDYVVEYRNAGDYTSAAQNGVEGIIKVITDVVGDEPWSEELKGEEVDLSMVLLIIGGLLVLLVIAIWLDGKFLGGTFFGGFGGGSSGSGSGFGGGGFGGGGASR